IDAMQDGGTLSIHTGAVTTASGAGVCIQIHDSGSGIPREILSKVFDPFFTTKRAKNGTGLGLSIVKSIIEMHKGSIEIKNKSDGGVTVTVLLSV
ncbi:MAG: HAMP domain-containing sensor histidine kinase, partial [Candidatus Omnitrophota bacterium]